jgi:curved DNA-binding protein CbpA
MAEDNDNSPERPKRANLPTGDPLGYYLALGLRPGSSGDVVRKAFLEQSTVFHPDRAGGDTADDVRDEMRRRFQLINEAYQVLGDARSRAAYDAAGAKGLAHLALLPNTVQDPAAVGRTVEMLEKKAELERTAKLIGSRGTTTLNFNGVRLWKVFWADTNKLLKVAQARQARKEQQMQDNAAAFQRQRDEAVEAAKAKHAERVAQAEAARKEQEAAAASAVTTADGERPTANGDEDSSSSPAHEAGQQQQQEPVMLQMAMGNFGGNVSQLAILPSEDLLIRLGMPKEQAAQTMTAIEAQTRNAQQQQQQQQLMQGQQAGGAAAGTLEGVTELPPFLKWRALLPESIEADHTYQQPIGSSSILLFTVGSKRTKKEASLFMKLHGEYHHSPITTLFATLRLAIDEFRATIGYVRELSPLWTLKSRLGLLDKTAFLPKFSIEAVRKLYENVALTNAIEWALGAGGGRFTSSVMRGEGEDDHTLGQVIISPTAGLSLATQHARPWAFLEGTDFEVPGSVTAMASVDPFAARLSGSVDVWCTKFEHWGFGAGVLVSMPIALSGGSMAQLRLLYRRGKHSVQIPITVLVSGDAAAAYPLGIALAPLTLYHLAVLASKPLLRASAVRQSRKKRQAILEEIREESERARRENDAMRRNVERRAAQEDKIGGLVIRNARLGVTRELSAEEAASDVPMHADVTLALQNCVRNSELRMPAGSKASLAGAFDPHPHATAHDRVTLRIEYWFNKRRHEVELPADAEIDLPRESHLVRAATAAAPAGSATPGANRAA